MKRLLCTYLLLLSVTFSVTQSQEPLWRKGGTIPTKLDLIDQLKRTRGLYYNDSAVFELGYDTLFLYNINTGRESKKVIKTKTLIDFSPNCLYLIVTKNDSLFSYNTSEEKYVFIRKGIEDIVHYTKDNMIALFKNGEVYNLSTGKQIRTLEAFDPNNILDKSDSLVFTRGQDENSLKIINIVTNTSRTIRYTPLTEGGFTLSGDGKTLIQSNKNVIRVMSITVDSVSKFQDITINTITNPDCFFLDNTKLFVIRIINSDSMRYEILDTKSFVLIKSVDFTRMANTNFREHKSYPGYNNAVLALLDAPNDCGGMPIIGASYRYVIVNPFKDNSVSLFPEDITPYDRSIAFTDNNTSLSFISRQNTIETFNTNNGEKVSSWDISSYYLSGFTQYAAGNRVLANTSNLIFCNQNKLYSFSLKNGIVQDSIVFGNNTIMYIKPTVDGKSIVCSAKDGSIYIIDRQSFTIKTSVDLTTPLNTLALNGDTLIYCTSGSKYVKRYNTHTQQMYDSVYVNDGVKILGTNGVTFIPTTKIEITRLKDNTALKNLSLGYQMGPNLYLNVEAVDNIPGYWKIHEHLQSHGDDEGYANTMTMQEKGDTLIYQKKWRNKFRCYTDDIVFSDDGRYCATISDDAFEVLKVINLISSVNENGHTQTQLSNSAYYIDGNVLTVNDKNEYSSCVLYSLTGENMGMCSTSNTENVTTITIPDYVRNGFYNMVLHSNKDIISKRILVNR